VDLNVVLSWTAAEIGYLASDDTGIFVEKSIANLIDGEASSERAVNMRDFAVLADEWLKREPCLALGSCWPAS
jgi:hypothetical protein